MKFLFVCGGTAGHINPALAVAEELHRVMPDAQIEFVGSGRELENRLVPKAGYKLTNIKMSGLQRKISPGMILHNVKTVKNLALASQKAGKILREFNPDAVIGTGGYICYPVLKKAAKMKIPTVIHESNAVPGLTTKLLSACADKVLVSFAGFEEQYKQPERVIVTGTPVRRGFDNRDAGALKPDLRPLVVSFWGSLGAAHMNEKMAEFIKLNVDSGLCSHIHAAGGQSSVEKLNKLLENLGVSEPLPRGIEIREYIDDMPLVMAAADIVLCRAGASTVAELTALGKPAVIVPSPYVTNNHQEENAKQLENAGGAVMLLEKDCTGAILYDTVLSILRDKDRFQSMSEAQKAMGDPGASLKIAELIISVVEID